MGFLVHRGLAGENPEVLAVGVAHQGVGVIPGQVQDRIVAPPEPEDRGAERAVEVLLGPRPPDPIGERCYGIGNACTSTSKLLSEGEPTA